MKSDFSVLSNLFLEFRPFAVFAILYNLPQYDCMQHERSMQSNKKKVGTAEFRQPAFHTMIANQNSMHIVAFYRVHF